MLKAQLCADVFPLLLKYETLGHFDVLQFKLHFQCFCSQVFWRTLPAKPFDMSCP